MKPDPFRPLLDDAACRHEVLTSIGQQLRSRYADYVSQRSPESLQALLRRLAESDRSRP
jgi:hypothetical protein